ncbi:hypothetical protein BGZ72_003427, partial [Mortierella alpina]
RCWCLCHNCPRCSDDPIRRYQAENAAARICLQERHGLCQQGLPDRGTSRLLHLIPHYPDHDHPLPVHPVCNIRIPAQ